MKNFEFVLTARLTQDCLENLLSCVRKKNSLPTPLEFLNNLWVLSIAQYFKCSEHGSYELDDRSFIAEFISVSPFKPNDVQFMSKVYDMWNQLDLFQSFSLELPELNSLNYLAGYIYLGLRKIMHFVLFACQVFHHVII